MRWASLLLLAGCGRIAFDVQPATGNGRDASTTGDGGADALVLPGAAFHLAFDDPYDAAGTSFLDSVSGQSGGVCIDVECPSPITGIHGQAYLFDGSLDCIHSADAAAFRSPAITIALWFRQDVLGNPSLVAKPYGQPSINDSWQIETYSDLSIASTSHHGAYVQITTPMNVFGLGTWTHVAMTFDGLNETIFVNGAQSVTTTRTVGIDYDSEPPLFGCDYNGGDAQYLAGALDDLWIFDRALTPSEIQLLATP